MPNPSNPFPDFSCPLCGGHKVEKIIIKRPLNRDYETQFWKCAICSVMMMNPRTFATRVTVQMPGVRGPQ